MIIFHLNLIRSIRLLDFHVLLLIVIDIFQLFFNNFLCKLSVILLFTVVPPIFVRLEQKLAILWTVKQLLIKDHIIAPWFDFALHFLLIYLQFFITLTDFIDYVLYDLLLHDNDLFHLFNGFFFNVDWNLHDLLDSLGTGIIRCNYCYWHLRLIFIILILVTFAVIFYHIELVLLSWIVDWRLLDLDTFLFWKSLYLG